MSPARPRIPAIAHADQNLHYRRVENPVATQSDSRMFWRVAGGVILGVLGWAVSSALGTGTHAGQSAHLSPADARQRDLLEQNLGKPGDSALGRQYLAINDTHFDGALPAIPVLWEPRLADVGALAAQSFTLEGMFGHIDGRAAILLNPSLQADAEALKRALCHEMVHAHLYSIGDPATAHGPTFQTELRRLSAEGAFTGIVATAEERADLRAWLKTESARLDAEHDAMGRDGAEIERERGELERALANLDPRDVDAVTAHREAYNQRAMDANARAARDRADVAEFNARAQRYNLMISYPDGR